VTVSERRGRSAKGHGRWWPIVFAVAAVACIYDADDRCGPNMQLSAVDSCACVEGYVLDGAVCVACPDGELESRGSCVCPPGFNKPTAGAPCEKTAAVATLGSACSLAEPCKSDEYPFCAEASNAESYCTSNGCRATSECSEGYACVQAASASFCRRSPSGMGKPCESAADCAGTEATYCETLISHSCLVQDCSLEADDCFEGWECCDVSAYGMPKPICVPAGECPT
jgi:hypothetical protein